MKKIFISIAFFISLFFTQNIKIVYAADLSENFSAISVADGKNNLFDNGDFVHVTAKFNDQKNKFTKGSTMLIPLDSDKKDVDICAINETKNLVIKDNNGKTYEVGKYVVKNNQVQVTFNDEIEKFKNIVGQIDFDIQVKNNADTTQAFQLNAGKVREKLYISSRPKLSDKIFTKITSDYDRDKNKTAWEINIDASKKKKVQLVNTIDGQKIDLDSLKVELNGKRVELNKDNFELDHGLKLKLDGGQITIKYTTDATNTVNVVRITDDKEISIYGEKSYVNDNVNISGELIQADTKDDQSKERISQFLSGLVKLITDQKHKKEETEKTDQKSDNKKQVELTQSVSKTGLKGFDTKTKIKTKNASSAKDITYDTDDSGDEDIDKTIEKPDSKSEKHQVEHTSSKRDLPKTGESNTFLLSAVGIIILSISTIIFYKKFGK